MSTLEIIYKQLGQHIQKSVFGISSSRISVLPCFVFVCCNFGFKFHLMDFCASLDSEVWKIYQAHCPRQTRKEKDECILDSAVIMNLTDLGTVGNKIMQMLFSS